MALCHAPVCKCCRIVQFRRPLYSEEFKGNIFHQQEENHYFPKNLQVISCINKKATLVWASGIDDSVLEYYKLEYKNNRRDWKEKLVKNPGRVKLVNTTLNSLQSGVSYKFRLQPDLNIPLSEYATAECTIEKENNNPDTGLSKAAMFGVGFVAGILLLALFGVSVICWLRRKTKLKSTKDHRVENQQAADQVLRVVEHSVPEETPDAVLPPTGHYEDLDTFSQPGPHYEVLTDMAPSSQRTSGNTVYENSSAL
ncbi:uncharacterized protein LOC135462665 [Liolophura sinensis]|uniref:uncharacterized protein LOC135462665 n=1 Tax=Liolophura sinensis TaxID=3198878 RepID=UPI003158F8E8